MPGSHRRGGLRFSLAESKKEKKIIKITNAVYTYVLYLYTHYIFFHGAYTSICVYNYNDM